METRAELELSIRTATLIKSLSQLIGVHDPLLARMMLMEAHEQFGDLAKFIEKQHPKRATRTSTAEPT